MKEKIQTIGTILFICAALIGISLIVAYKALGGGWQIREGNDFIPNSN